MKRVLFVDDEPAVLEALQRSLYKHSDQWDMGFVTSALEALAILDAGRLDVIVSDLRMPQMDGLELLEYIKGHAEFRTIPVVMLTGSREERDLVKSYKLGVNGYVVKPIVFEEFVSSVKELGLFWAVINTPPPGSVKARM